MDAVQVLGSHNELGEGPLWRSEEQALYWVDIGGKTINRYWPATGNREEFSVNVNISVIAFREKGGFIAAGSDGISFWDLGENSFEPIANPEKENKASRFNDGKVDRAGRFWAGTMTSEGTHSSLYRVDKSLDIQTMETNITISNGIGWSPDNRTMYYADSLHYVIYAYDFDLATGNIRNRRDWVIFDKAYGIPDGLTVDSEGYVWCAFYFGSKVTRFDPNGKINCQIDLPVSAPTSCCFGGENLTDLYITSARIDLTAEEQRNQPLAGDIFMVKTNTQGIPEPEFVG